MQKVLTVCEDFLKPNRMNPVFCIPTYKRPGLIVKRTLKVLKDQCVPQDWIHLYVADEEERKSYESTVPSDMYGQLHVARPGLAPARNFILESWPLGQSIVMMDDDVTDVMTRDVSGALVRANLLRVAEYGFATASDVGCCMWGVYPVCNGFFMKDFVTSDLRFCVGPLFGLVNPGVGGHGIELPLSEKEDYIRTLMAYDRDGAVIRINNVAVKTTYYKTPGGMQDPERRAKQETAVQYILSRWPDRTAVDTRKKKSGYPEIKIKTIRTERTQIRIPPSFS